MWAAKRFYVGTAPRLFTLNITASVARPNIYQLATNAGWNQQVELLVNITAPLVNTIDIPASQSYPKGLTLVVGPSTRVGGVRGSAEVQSGLIDQIHINGQPALRTRVPVTLVLRGVVSGGGGKGSDGRDVTETGVFGLTATGPGGAGGWGQGFVSVSGTVVSAAGNGNPGQTVESSAFGAKVTATGEDGADGGAWGTAGLGGFGVHPNGLAGASIDGISFVTLQIEGGQLVGPRR